MLTILYMNSMKYWISKTGGDFVMYGPCYDKGKLRWGDLCCKVTSEDFYVFTQAVKRSHGIYRRDIGKAPETCFNNPIEQNFTTLLRVRNVVIQGAYDKENPSQLYLIWRINQQPVQSCVVEVKEI